MGPLRICFNCFSCHRCRSGTEEPEPASVLNAVVRPPTPAPDNRMFRNTRAFFRNARRRLRRRRPFVPAPTCSFGEDAIPGAGGELGSSDTLFGVPEIESELASDYVTLSPPSSLASDVPLDDLIGALDLEYATAPESPEEEEEEEEEEGGDDAAVMRYSEAGVKTLLRLHKFIKLVVFLITLLLGYLYNRN